MTANRAMRPVLALGLSSLQGVWRSKLVMLALVFSVVHVAIRVAVVVAISLFAPGAEGRFFNAGFLYGTIELQATLPAVIVLGAVGTRTATRDRLMGGLEFIMSKALPRWGYVAGRAIGPVVAALLLIFAPIVLLVVAMIAMVDPLPAGSTELLWGALGTSLVVSLAIGPLAAGLGSMVEDLRSATGLWLAVAWATLPLSAFLREAGISWWWATSPLVTIQQTAGTMLELSFPGDDVLLGWLVVAAIVAVPLGLLYHRTREVYG